MTHVHTLTAADVERPWHRIAGRTWLVSDWIGRVLPCDIGKRVYLNGGILQVENEAQMRERLSDDHARHGGDLCTEGPDGCCTVCAVAMWNPCEVCGGRGYHRDTCNAEDAWDDSPEGRGVTP